MRLGRGADEAHRGAAQPGAAGAADAVGVVVGRARQVVVDHRRQRRDVDAARGQIGHHQHANAPGAEGRQHLGAGALAQLAVQRMRRHALAAELVRDQLGGMAGGDEDQHPVPAMRLQQLAQHAGAPAGVERNRALVDVGMGRGALAALPGRAGDRPRRDVDAHRRAQQRIGQRLHRRREGRREQQVLPARRQQRQHAGQLVGEAQVEQPVGLVEHQRAHMVEPDRVVVDQIEQPARRGHHQLGAAAQGHHLRIDRHAAEQHRHPWRIRQPARQIAQQLAGLHRQLARRHQHQPVRRARPGTGGGQIGLQQRQREGQRLARAGLRRDLQIRARERGGNRLGLHRRGLRETEFAQRAQQGRLQAEGNE